MLQYLKKEKAMKDKHLKDKAIEIWRTFTAQEKRLVRGLCMFPAVKMESMPADPHEHHQVICFMLDLSKQDQEAA